MKKESNLIYIGVIINEKQLQQLSAYQPGLSPQALKEKFGIEGELYKLASNENLYDHHLV